MPPFPPAGHVHDRISTGTVKIVRHFAAILQELQTFARREVIELNTSDPDSIQERWL